MLTFKSLFLSILLVTVFINAFDAATQAKKFKDISKDVVVPHVDAVQESFLNDVDEFAELLNSYLDDVDGEEDHLEILKSFGKVQESYDQFLQTNKLAETFLASSYEVCVKQLSLETSLSLSALKKAVKIFSQVSKLFVLIDANEENEFLQAFKTFVDTDSEEDLVKCLQFIVPSPKPKLNSAMVSFFRKSRRMMSTLQRGHLRSKSSNSFVKFLITEMDDISKGTDTRKDSSSFDKKQKKKLKKIGREADKKKKVPNRNSKKKMADREDARDFVYDDNWGNYI